MPAYISPNGSPIIGTYEKLVARAEIIDIDEDGTPNYQGQTTIFWDGQETVTRDGKIVFLDQDGEEWTFDQLTIDDHATGDDEHVQA